MSLTARQRYEQSIEEGLALLAKWQREDEQLIAENERLIAALKRSDMSMTRPEVRTVR